MKEVERVAKTYGRFYALTILLLYKLLSWKLPEKAEVDEFRQLGKKVERINRRYVNKREVFCPNSKKPTASTLE